MFKTQVKGDLMKDIKKNFPDYFKHFQFPFGTCELSLLVYRACKTKKIERASFLSTYEERGGQLDSSEINNPSMYSMSVYENPKDVRRFTLIRNNHVTSQFKIAIGYTLPKYGVVCRSNGLKKRKSSHVD